MTALKLNRFSLSEIENITIRCKKCGAGHIVTINSERLGIEQCPSCGIPYGELAENVFYRFQKAYQAMEEAGKHIDIEFDIIEK